MIGNRAGSAPKVPQTVRLAPGAYVLGNVILGEHCVIDCGAVITSSGPPVRLADGVVVMANAVIRSAGGAHRPAFPVTIGADCLIGPGAVLAGCELGNAVYVATQVMVFQGARVGDGSRLGAGSIVHTGAVLAARSRVGMRQFAVAADGSGAVITSDLDIARRHLAQADFFGHVFGLGNDDPADLHRRSVELLRSEAADWEDAVPRTNTGC